MTETATFGLASYDLQTYLPGTDPALLPAVASLAPPVANALVSQSYSPAANGTQSLYYGSVTETTTGFGTADRHTTYDVVGPWNSVKNASIVTDGGHVTLAGFVHVDAAATPGNAAPTDLDLIGVKRGSLVTGDGADTVDVQVASNGADWSNDFHVNTGGGKDVVAFSVLDTKAAAAADPTFASAIATSIDYGYSGSATHVYLNLGAGDDAAKGLAGNDVIDGGTGSSFLTGGGGADEFHIDARGGTVTWSTVTDWQAGDHLSLLGWQAGVSTATWVEHAGATGYEGATMHADLNGDGTIDASITFTGLDVAQAPASTAAHAAGELWFG